MHFSAFVGVCVFLCAFFLHDCVGRPNALNLKQVFQREQNCRVADFETQSNFQQNRFIGTWYHIAQSSSSRQYQRRSHYSFLKDGSGLNMRTTKIIGEQDCSTYEFNAIGQPEDSNVPAKMNLLLPNGRTEPYWVLYTDYDHMAVIYSCGSIAANGECQVGQKRIFVVSRTTQLSATQLQHVEQLLEGVCIATDRLQFVPSDCDSSLGITPPSLGKFKDPTTIKNEIQSCIVDDFRVHENFNINKYLGTWYTVAHVQPAEYPYQRKSVYSLSDEGAIAMSTQRISRDGACSTRNFDAVTFWPRGLTNSAKLLLNITGMAMPPEDYWLLYVDYDAYAIVYSCSDRSGDGTCNDDAKHVWVMSRLMAELSDKEMARVEKVLRDVCVDPKQLEMIPNGCDRVLDLLTGYGHGKEEEIEEIMETEEIEISCAVDDFQVQDNFIIEEFLGEWYSIKYRNPAIYDHDTSFRTIEFSASKDKDAAHMDVTIKDIKIGDTCGIAKNQNGVVWVSDTEPAKLTISFQEATGKQQRDVGGWNFWIVATDYTNYAVAYACHEIGEFNTCSLKAEEIWVLSRRLSLAERYQYHIDNAVQYVCMEPDELISNNQPCQQTPVQSKLNIKQEKFILGTPSILAELNTRTCDPATAEFGCCLLEDKPASGPNYEGCPRVPPPVAGQPLPGEPLEIQFPGECDERIMCKMYCEFGFALDAFGCEMCKCALEPQEVIPTKIPAELIVEANIPADLVVEANNCDPATAEFGCCLLEDKPASGPNYEGCPRAPAPVAGQPLPGVPEEIQVLGECEQKIQCKMYCEFGFATNAYGCEVCQCADEPQQAPLEANVQVAEVQFRVKLTECEEQREAMQKFLKGTAAQDQLYYLPQCDANGLFEIQQCYAKTTVCWCVDPITGSVVNC